MTALDNFRIFGESLKAARIEQKRSLDDVASAIKINRRHLEAIESGDFDKLPQGPYVAAFLREYARALGLRVPPELAPVPGALPSSPRDPKVVSHPAGTQERSGQFSHAARGTARFANTAVKSAVKTVSKTTENVVNLVETGGKEALEVLTSKSLWDEAENIRRERHGLPPLEQPPTTHQKRIDEDKREDEEKRLLGVKRAEEEASAAMAQSSSLMGQRVSKSIPIRSSKRITNIVIVALAILFAGVAYLAIRMSKSETSATASKDYIPAPIEKPQPIPAPKHAAAAPAPTVATANPGVKDSLRFVLRAIQPVWVSIAPDGIPAYRGELKTGDVRSFRAADKFVVNIGNQKSVSMTFDGASLSSLPAVQNSSVVIRDLVLTRDRVTLGGTTVDLHKPVGAVNASKPIPLPPAKAPALTSTKKALPALHNKPASNIKPKSKTPAKVIPKSKGASSKPVKGKKPVKKAYSPPLIHSVEPIPPRP